MKLAHGRRWIVGGAIFFAFAALAAFWRCLPDPLFTAPVSSVLLARDAELLGARIAADGQWRFPLSQQIPERYRVALTAFEDRRFSHHPGVDPFALARAVYQNVRAGKVVSGASTITMQVVRLARENRRRTYREKLVEMILALRLELTTTKDEILALYASHAPFGGNVVGLEAAAWRYFGRSPDNLSWAETCLLAVLPNNPALVHPGRNRDVLKQKRDGLLRRLSDVNAIDGTELRLALLEPLPEDPQPLPQDAPHLLATLSSTATQGENRFASSIDADLQRSVASIVSRHTELLELQGISNAAVLVLDNRNFETLAYVGNSRWSVNNGSGFAIDLIQRPRSTGSVLKPLLFARMLEAGEIVPQTLVPDLPTQYAGYMPENYDGTFRGAVPAREALARSLNVPAVRMLRQHGVDRFYDFLRNLGMQTLQRRPRDYGLTLILGGAEGTLWDLTAMYANVAAIARAAPGKASTYLRPKILKGNSTATSRNSELSAGSAWLTLEALVEVVRPGIEGSWRDFGNAQKIAWKTGTSFGRRDAWAIGSTATYTVGVWVGNATGVGRPNLTGVTTAAPILFGVFNRLDHAEWFPRPDHSLRQIEVCRNDGLLPAAGCVTEPAWTPVNSHFEMVSPHHRRIHLDRSGTHRVHGRCESAENMIHRSWFVLPAGQEFYYRRYHTSYSSLPAYRDDCSGHAVATDDEAGPLAFLYPNTGTRIYIPVDLAGKRGRVVFEAAHRDPDATLFWHLDDKFIGTTKAFHEQALDIRRGTHTLTVVDEQGNRLRRQFEVLARGARGSRE